MYTCLGMHTDVQAEKNEWNAGSIICINYRSTLSWPLAKPRDSYPDGKSVRRNESEGWMIPTSLDMVNEREGWTMELRRKKGTYSVSESRVFV